MNQVLNVGKHLDNQVPFMILLLISPLRYCCYL